MKNLNKNLISRLSGFLPRLRNFQSPLKLLICGLMMLPTLSFGSSETQGIAQTSKPFETKLKSFQQKDEVRALEEKIENLNNTIVIGTIIAEKKGYATYLYRSLMNGGFNGGQKLALGSAAVTLAGYLGAFLGRKRLDGASFQLAMVGSWFGLVGILYSFGGIDKAARFYSLEYDWQLKMEQPEDHSEYLKGVQSDLLEAKLQLVRVKSAQGL